MHPAPLADMAQSQRLWRPLLLLAGVASSLGCSERAASDRLRFEATAFSIEGTTASGVRTREGIVAADPAVLPLGSRIRIYGAGEYSGDYVVEDVGPAIKGREIDIYIDSDGEAKRFGRRTVEVELLERGAGREHRS